MNTNPGCINRDKKTGTQSIDPDRVLIARTFEAHIIHQDQIPCNLTVTDLKNFDIFQGVKSINKRRIWFYLWNSGTGSFVTKNSVADDLRMRQSVVGRCLYSLAMDGIIKYQYYAEKGYFITYVAKIAYKHFDVQPSCPFGFQDCESCLFLKKSSCAVGESWRSEE